jgi:hypothetical protein
MCAVVEFLADIGFGPFASVAGGVCGVNRHSWKNRQWVLAGLPWGETGVEEKILGNCP